jgi:hypothetical protein
VTGLAVLLLAAAGGAYGVWVALRSRPPLLAAVAAAILFAAGGVLAVLVWWVTGDGIVLPDLQLSPGLKAYYLQEADWRLAPSVNRWLLLAAPLAHLILVLARRDRTALLAPLPATAIFVGLLLAVREEPGAVVRARGPEQVGYLTVAREGAGARLIVASGEPFAPFLRILHVHETEIPPPELHLDWTRDGRALAIRIHEEKDHCFAVDLTKKVTGGLPAAAREWPAAYVPQDVSKRFSEYRKDVFKLIHEHGGLAPP